MALTFDVLRSRSNTALAKAQVGTPLDELTPEQVGALDQALSRRVTIENNAASDKQILANGGSRWFTEWVRTTCVSAPKQLGLSDQEIASRIWKTLPNCPFKRFQEAFCPPHRFIVPLCEIGNDGRVKFLKGPIDFAHLTVKGCLVDAALIPDALVGEGLKLVTFGPEDFRNPESKLLKKIAAVEKFKELFDQLEPLEDGDYRFNVFKRCKQTPSHLHGVLLYSREGGADRRNMLGPRFSRRRTFAIYEDLYSGERKTEHQRRGQTRENKTLSALMSQFKTLTESLDGWHRDTDPVIKEALRVEAIKLIRKGRTYLRTHDNEFKKQAHLYLTRVRNFKDSLGRKNRPVIQWHIREAVTNISRRLTELHKKSGYNEVDSKIIMTQRELHEQVFESLRGAIERTAPMISSHTRLFANTRLSAAQIRVDAEGLQNVLGLASLQRVQIRPFLTVVDQMAHLTDELKAALKPGGLNSAQRTLVRMHVLLRFESALQCLSHACGELVEENSVALPELITSVGESLKALKSKAPFSGYTIPEWRKPYREVGEEVAAVLGKLKAFDRESPEWNAITRKEKFEELRERIKAFKIEERIRALPRLPNSGRPCNITI